MFALSGFFHLSVTLLSFPSPVVFFVFNGVTIFLLFILHRFYDFKEPVCNIGLDLWFVLAKALHTAHVSPNVLQGLRFRSRLSRSLRVPPATRVKMASTSICLFALRCLCSAEAVQGRCVVSPRATRNHADFPVVLVAGPPSALCVCQAEIGCKQEAGCDSFCLLHSTAVTSTCLFFTRAVLSSLL